MSKKAEELARAVAKSVSDAIHTPIVLDIYGSAVDLIDAALRKERERCAERLHAVMKAKVTFDYPGQSAQPIIEEMFERQFSVYRAAILADEED